MKIRKFIKSAITLVSGIIGTKAVEASPESVNQYTNGINKAIKEAGNIMAEKSEILYSQTNNRRNSDIKFFSSDKWED